MKSDSFFPSAVHTRPIRELQVLLARCQIFDLLGSFLCKSHARRHIEPYWRFVCVPNMSHNAILVIELEHRSKLNHHILKRSGGFWQAKGSRCRVNPFCLIDRRTYDLKDFHADALNNLGFQFGVYSSSSMKQSLLLVVVRRDALLLAPSVSNAFFQCLQFALRQQVAICF